MSSERRSRWAIGPVEVMGGGKTGDELGGSQFDGVEVRLKRQANSMVGEGK